MTPQPYRRSIHARVGFTHFAGSVQAKRAAWNARADHGATPVVPRSAT